MIKSRVRLLNLTSFSKTCYLLVFARFTFQAIAILFEMTAGIYEYPNSKYCTKFGKLLFNDLSDITKLKIT